MAFVVVPVFILNVIVAYPAESRSTRSLVGVKNDVSVSRLLKIERLNELYSYGQDSCDSDSYGLLKLNGWTSYIVMAYIVMAC